MKWTKTNVVLLWVGLILLVGWLKSREGAMRDAEEARAEAAAANAPDLLREHRERTQKGR